jgi:hypothetical protein
MISPARCDCLVQTRSDLAFSRAEKGLRGRFARRRATVLSRCYHDIVPVQAEVLDPLRQGRMRVLRRGGTVELCTGPVRCTAVTACSRNRGAKSGECGRRRFRFLLRVRVDAGPVFALDVRPSNCGHHEGVRGDSRTGDLGCRVVSLVLVPTEEGEAVGGEKRCVPLEKTLERNRRPRGLRPFERM